MPPAWRDIHARSAAMGFSMPSDKQAGALLRALAASKPGGRLLELGTGTGLATACLMAGMDSAAHLISLDVDETLQAVARGRLGHDPRVRFELADGLTWIAAAEASSFDLIFADAWPGKYEGLDEALRLLRPGGAYLADDMLPQPNWPDGHQARADALTATLCARRDMTTVSLAWGSGFVMAIKSAA